MARKISLDNVKKTRIDRKENQADFWKRFGVTQSGGSRYESGRRIPPPTQKLMRLFLSGTITEETLQAH